MRSQFGKESRKTTFFIMRTCPFDSVLVVCFLLSDRCRAILNSTTTTVLSDFFSLVYLIFSRAIKPGAFSDYLKRCEYLPRKRSADSHIKVGYLYFIFVYIVYFSYAYSSRSGDICTFRLDLCF